MVTPSSKGLREHSPRAGWGFRVRPDPEWTSRAGSHISVSTCISHAKFICIVGISESCKCPFLGVLGVAKDAVPFCSF